MREMPIQRQLESGLSERELACVGEIAMNWGAVDFYIDAALVNSYKDISTDHAKLIHSLSAQQKSDVLADLLKDGRLPEKCKAYLEALRFAFSNYKSPRNFIAHGLSVKDNGVNRLMQASGKTIAADDLDVYLQQSRYALFAVKWLLQIVRGHEHPMPLPEKPPAKRDPADNTRPPAVPNP